MHHLRTSPARLAGLALALVLLAGGAAVGSNALAQEGETVIQACKHTVTGRLRAVAAPTAAAPRRRSAGTSRARRAGGTGRPGRSAWAEGRSRRRPDDAERAGRPRLHAGRRAGRNRRPGAGADGDVTLLCVVDRPPPPPTGGRLVINEVDYDQVGTDGDGFVEIANTGTARRRPEQRRARLRRRRRRARVPPRGAHRHARGRRVRRRRRRRAERRARGPRALEHLDEGGDRRLSYEGAISSATIDGVTVSLVEGTVLPSTVADSNTVAGSLIRNPDGKDTDDAAADWAFTTTLTRGAANVHTPP